MILSVYLQVMLFFNLILVTFIYIVSKTLGGAFMKKNKLIIILTLLIFVIGLTGCGLGKKSLDSKKRFNQRNS
jgi:hypothetical protein